MMKLILAITLLASPLLSCSVIAGTKLPTIQDQIRYAGAIIRGKVKSAPGTVNESYVNLENAVFYRGAGPSDVRINGFTSSAACGIDQPKAGTELILFVCRDGKDWKLNRIGVSTGAAQASTQNVATLESQTATELRTEGANFVQYKQCGKMPESNNSNLSNNPINDGGSQWTFPTITRPQ